MTEPSPLVTIYVVNHNFAPYVRQAIDSALAQTCRDLEILIIDDGSSDGSREMLEAYEGHDRVMVVFQRNKGLTVTNNIALRMARGKYIMRLDGDDYLDLNAVDIMAGMMERDPLIGMVFPDYYLVDPHGDMLGVVRRQDVEETGLLDRPAHGACTMIRRDLLVELGGYDESFSCQDGYELWIRFVKHHQVRNVNLPLFYYRQHPASLTRNEKRLLETRSRILDKHAEQIGQPLDAVAVIPVRGSTDPHSFPLRDLAGRTLIQWSIDAALASRRIRDVVVTTPDQRVLDFVSEVYGDRVIAHRRESSLAKLNTSVEDTIFEALESYLADAPRPAALVMLFIESPFRQPHQIDSAVDVLQVFETDHVVSVRPEPTSVFYRHSGHSLEPLQRDNMLKLESDEIYRGAGNIYVGRMDYLLQYKTMRGGRIGHLVVDQPSAHKIESEWDWKVAVAEAQSRKES